MIPLLDNGEVDVDVLANQVDWSHLSAFEGVLLTFEDIDWDKLTQEVRECPNLAKLTWNNNDNLLRIAAHDNQPELVDLLIDCGADVNLNREDGTPVYCSVWGGNVEILKALVCVDGVVDGRFEHGWSPLHLASYKGYSDITKVLLEAGADTDLQDNNERTPLDLSVQRRYVDIARLLVEQDAKYTKSQTQKFIDSGGLHRE